MFFAHFNEFFRLSKFILFIMGIFSIIIWVNLYLLLT